MVIFYHQESEVRWAIKTSPKHKVGGYDELTMEDILAWGKMAAIRLGENAIKYDDALTLAFINQEKTGDSVDQQKL